MILRTNSQRVVITADGTGQRPLPAGGRRQEILPDPTTTLQARAQPLDFDKNVGKTLMVENSAERRGGPGYYCELCRRTCKDSMGYLDHINGKTRECSGG